jgi:predicted nucleic acid-binding protein
VSARLEGQRVYFDSNIVIYILEGFADFATQIAALRRAIAEGSLAAVASDLTLAEVLVQPFKRGDSAAVAAYRAFVETSGAFDLVGVGRDDFVRAAYYRAAFNLGMADALHIAAARAARCTALLTNDKRLRLPEDIERIDFGSLA